MTPDLSDPSSKQLSTHVFKAQIGMPIREFVNINLAFMDDLASLYNEKHSRSEGSERGH